MFVFSSEEINRLPDGHMRRFVDIRKRLHIFQFVPDLEAAMEHVNNRLDGRLGVISSWEEEINQMMLNGSDAFDLRGARWPPCEIDLIQRSIYK